MSDAQAVPATENGSPAVVQDKVEEAPGFKVFAGNLAYSTTDEGLKAFFAPVQSDIISAQVIQRGTRSAGYGFVALATAEAAQKAVEALDKKELDGRQVIIEVAKPSEQKEKKEKKVKKRTGRRGSKAVPGEVSEAEANGEVEKTEAVADAPLITDEATKPKKKKKASKRKAKKIEGAEAATDSSAAAPAEPAADAPKKAPRVRKPKAPRVQRPAGEDPAGELSKTVVFVANLGFNIDDAGLSALFTEAGIQVVSARIVRKPWGQPRKSKGYGFVDVGSEAEQTKAIAALHGKEVSSRPIAVKVAVNTRHEDEEETGAAPVEVSANDAAPAAAAAATPAAV